MSTATSTAVEPTLIFKGNSWTAGDTCEVHQILGKNARYEVRINGTVEHTILATRAWKHEQREAIEWAQRELGYRDVDGQPNVGAAAAIATGPKPVSGLKINRMAILWADIARDKGYAELPEKLRELGRERAEFYAGLGRETFDKEMARLQAERCEQEEDWDAAARAKITYY